MKNFLLFFLWAMFLWVNTAVHAADMTATLKDNTANSGFSVVNAGGTTTARFRGDGNVGIGTTTPSARFMIVGSSTSGSDASLVVTPGGTGVILYARNDRRVGINTGSPTTELHVIGTVTATGFVGDGSGLTGISGSSGTPTANSVSSSSIVDGSVTGGDLASTLSMSTKSLDIGSITVNAGNFRVDSTGSMTATTITSTGSVTASAITTTGTLTASGNLNIDSGTLFVDSANNRVGVGTTTPQTAFAVSGTATVTNGYFGVGTNNPGARLTIHTGGSDTGSAGLGITDGTYTAYITMVHTGSLNYVTANAHVFYTPGLYEIFRATSNGKMGVGTDTPQTKLHVIGTVTATGFVGDGSGLTNISSAPTIQKFTSGSGTYTKPSRAKYIRVRMVGGGGGGTGGGGSAGYGGSGGSTTFGDATAPGGGGTGAGASDPTLGTGSAGTTLSGNESSGIYPRTTYNAGGDGASSFWGKGGNGGGSFATGYTASSYGAGGGGGASVSVQWPGRGGGSGSFIDAIYASPSSTYSYSVGAGGAGGAPGSGGGGEGGAGASGYIEVTEYY